MTMILSNGAESLLVICGLFSFYAIQSYATLLPDPQHYQYHHKGIKIQILLLPCKSYEYQNSGQNIPLFNQRRGQNKSFVNQRRGRKKLFVFNLSQGRKKSFVIAYYQLKIAPVRNDFPFVLHHPRNTRPFVSWRPSCFRHYLVCTLMGHSIYLVSCRASTSKSTFPPIWHVRVRLLNQRVLRSPVLICSSTNSTNPPQNKSSKQPRQKSRQMRCNTRVHCMKCEIKSFSPRTFSKLGALMKKVGRSVGQQDFVFVSTCIKPEVCCRLGRELLRNMNIPNKIKQELQHYTNDMGKSSTSVAMRQGVLVRRRRHSINQARPQEHGGGDSLLQDAVLDMERLERQRKIGNLNKFRENYKHRDGLEHNGHVPKGSRIKTIVPPVQKQWDNDPKHKQHKKTMGVKNVNDQMRHYKQHYGGQIKNGRRERVGDFTGNAENIQKRLENERKKLYEEYLAAYEKVKNQERKNKDEDTSKTIRLPSLPGERNYDTVINRNSIHKASPRLGRVRNKADTVKGSGHLKPHWHEKIKPASKDENRHHTHKSLLRNALARKNKVYNEDEDENNDDEPGDESASPINNRHGVMGIRNHHNFSTSLGLTSYQGRHIVPEYGEHQTSVSGNKNVTYPNDHRGNDNDTNTDVVDIVDKGNDNIALNVTGPSWESIIHGHRDVIIAGCVVISIGLTVLGCAITSRLVRTLKEGSANQSNNQSKSYRTLGSQEERMNLKDSNFSLFIESTDDEEDEEDETKQS